MGADKFLLELREFLSYDPETGMFHWRKNRGRVRKGAVAGCLAERGVILIVFQQVLYKAHRLAWLHYYGVWPTEDIDHKDGDPSNNRIRNLREATDSQNLANMKKPVTNTSGKKGVSWHEGAQKWQAHIRVRGQNNYLGLFNSVDDAHDAYVAAAHQYHGEFGRAA